MILRFYALVQQGMPRGFVDVTLTVWSRFISRYDDRSAGQEKQGSDTRGKSGMSTFHTIVLRS